MPSLSRLLLSTASLLSVASATSYGLVNNYDGSNWASGFQFFDDPDPTAGYVNYLSESAASGAGLYKTVGSQVYMGVDNTTNNPAAPGRNSVRVSTSQTWTYGLFVWDLAHVPDSICSVWPALWTVGSDWPNNGEIDGMILASLDQIRRN
jgi:hypothetical protein